MGEARYESQSGDQGARTGLGSSKIAMRHIKYQDVFSVASSMWFFHSASFDLPRFLRQIDPSNCSDF